MLRNFTIIENEVVEEMVSKPTITSKFCILMTIYAGLLLVSNIIANKVIMPFGVVLPSAVILFPCVYIISDLSTEVYGIRLSKLAIYTNTALNLFMSLIFMIAVMIPGAPFADSTAFDSVLGSTPRIVFASLISYFLGDMINSYSLSFFKAKLSNITLLNTFIFRSIFSSMLGQIFDTMGFIVISFYGIVPNEVLMSMIINQYMVKIGYQIVIHPIMHHVVKWWKKVENLDVVDKW